MILTFPSAEYQLEAYIASVERDEARLAELRAMIEQYKRMFRVH